MATYKIEASEETVHTFFSAELAPILTIDPGDTVQFRTLDAGGGLEPPTAPGAPRHRLTPHRQGMPGHALCGPIAIRGAQPGMTLVVHIGEVRPGDWGWTFAGGEWAQGEEALHVWRLDAETMLGHNQHGYSVPLRPFMGVLGMPTAEPGQHSTIPPRPTGGNIDCKELVPGSTLYLPIAVPGALFSVGDGHAVQGDGEISGTGIECPMTQVKLTFELRDDLSLAWPRARTPGGWLTLAFDEQLNQATLLAVNGMLDLMVEQYGLRRPDALALASLVVDLRITQVVNQVCGVHAWLPHGILCG